jgi:hypothetical protein
MAGGGTIGGTSNEAYFDEWGSRAYTFADQGNYKLLDLDAANALGGTYVVSSFQLIWARLEPVESLDLEKLFLYKIVPSG